MFSHLGIVTRLWPHFFLVNLVFLESPVLLGVWSCCRLWLLMMMLMMMMMLLMMMMMMSLFDFIDLDFFFLISNGRYLSFHLCGDYDNDDFPFGFWSFLRICD